MTDLRPFLRRFFDISRALNRSCNQKISAEIRAFGCYDHKKGTRHTTKCDSIRQVHTWGHLAKHKNVGFASFHQCVIRENAQKCQFSGNFWEIAFST